MHRKILVMVSACLIAACGQDDQIGGPAAALVAMQYNVAQQGEGARGAAIVDDINSVMPDFLAAEECTNCDWLAAGADLALTESGAADVGLAYDESRWMLAERGAFPLGENDDGWGHRVTKWGLFEDVRTGFAVYVYATHWCVTIRTPDDACDVAKQLSYFEITRRQIAGRTYPDLPVVLAGDLNVFDGFEDGPVIEEIERSGFVDTVRARGPVADTSTFQGNAWAPPGDIDYIFAMSPVEVEDAYVDRSVPVGEGSDHFAVVSRILFTGLR